MSTAMTDDLNQPVPYMRLTAEAAPVPKVKRGMTIDEVVQAIAHCDEVQLLGKACILMWPAGALRIFYPDVRLTGRYVYLSEHDSSLIWQKALHEVTTPA